MTERPQHALRLVAHRGWPKYFPENTLISFEAAISARTDEIEFDVWASKDGVPVLCHDSTVDRMSDLEGPVGDFTINELAAAAIRLPGGERIEGVGFTTFEQALDCLLGRVVMNVHIKDPGPDNVILRDLRERLGGRRPPCGSYVAGGRQVLEAALDVCPEIPRCCLDGQSDGGKLVANALEYQCERVQFGRERYEPEHVAAALEAGMITNLFWSDDAEEIVALFGQGIVAPLVNDIGTVRAALKRLGAVK